MKNEVDGSGFPGVLAVLMSVVVATLAVAVSGHIWIEMGRPDRLDFLGLVLLCIALLGHVALIAVRQVAQ